METNDGIEQESASLDDGGTVHLQRDQVKQEDGEFGQLHATPKTEYILTPIAKGASNDDWLREEFDADDSVYQN